MRRALLLLALIALLGLGSQAHAQLVSGGPPTGGGGAATSVSSTAPASPVLGQLWFNTSDLQTYIWYNDGTSTQWTAIVNQIGSGGGGGFTAGGDLSGNPTSQIVTGIQTKPVPAPATGVLYYSGSAFSWNTTLTGITISNPTFTGSVTMPAGSITDTMLANGYSGIGTCSSGQYVSALNRNAAPTCATPAGGGGGIGEAPTDGSVYFRQGSTASWQSGGTVVNDIIVSAVHLTNLSGWAPINFGNPNLTAGTGGAVTASLFAYSPGAGSNNNLNITAGSHMWNGNWVSDTPTAEGIVLNPTSIAFQYSTGNTVGSTLGAWNSIGSFASTGLNLVVGNYQYGGAAVGGTCSAGSAVTAISGHIGMTCSAFASTASPTFTGTTTMTNISVSGTVSLPASSVTDSMLAGAYSGVGACSAGSAATTLNRNAAPTCTAFASSSSPTFTGTTTMTNLTVSGTVSLPAGSITDAMLTGAYSGVGACAAGSVATTLTRNAAPTCTALSSLGAGVFAPVSNPTFTGTTTITNLSVSGTVSLPAGSITNSMLATPVPLTGTISTVGFDFSGTVPANAIGAFTCVIPLTIPANFASPNSQLTCGVNPNESDAYTVKVNGATVGTITVSTSCGITLGSSSATTCAAGQRMEVDAPFTVSGSDITISIGVTR